MPIVPDGGTPPYECTVSAGVLPPGLNLSGCATTLSGVPSAAGLYVFTVRTRDGAQPAATHFVTRHVVVTDTLPAGP